MSVLQQAIFSSQPPSPDVKEALLQHLWPVPKPATGPHAPDPTTTTPHANADDLDAWFAYLHHECRPPLATHHAMQTFADMFLIAACLRDNPGTSLAGVQSLVAAADAALASDPRKLVASVELVVRLWLAVSVRGLMPASRHDLEVSLPWPETQSLADVLHAHLCPPPTASRPTMTTTTTATESFPRQLNVVNMKRIAGFRVIWTNNLVEHLAVRGSSVYLFHQVSVLKRIKATAAAAAAAAASDHDDEPGRRRRSLPLLLPDEFVDETLATLGLLVPHSMAACNVWLRGETARLGLDRDLMYRATADRRKGSYPYWQDRLAALCEAFDRTKPSSPMQWWHDRRDMGQWWGFWLVVAGIALTVLFGLIQSITGILQVVGASHA
ncbi:class I glutamine amidotransferase-like protein [Purpureocillium lavendulum]|uniref:Class I glutamine amidotransferase-like protein n=1 Tax=Purpureocillium lavendulum TaxID=1247861 RepID=A0AB34FSR8_9HYPO|nr:class I glutamine amidotransferase-like protein [Purpureocillium lavendulum]